MVALTYDELPSLLKLLQTTAKKQKGNSYFALFYQLPKGDYKAALADLGTFLGSLVDYMNTKDGKRVRVTLFLDDSAGFGNAQVREIGTLSPALKLIHSHDRSAPIISRKLEILYFVSLDCLPGCSGAFLGGNRFLMDEMRWSVSHSCDAY